MKTTEISISERINFSKKMKNQKFEPVSIMKKLRSKIPRKKRFQISPILSKPKVSSSVSLPDEISCTSNLISVGSETLQELKLSLKKKKNQKNQILISETENRSDDRRIITRSYYRKVIAGESSSSGVVFSGDDFSGGNSRNNVCEAISETSCIQSKRNFKSEEEEFTSNNESAKKKSKVVEIQGDDNNNNKKSTAVDITVSEITFLSKSVSSSDSKNQNQFASNEIRDHVTSASVEPDLEVVANSESVAVIEIPSDTESDCVKLVCSEELTGESESDYSKTASELDSDFSDYIGSSLFDSESQTGEDFSQGSPYPTAYFSFLTQYSNEFSTLSSLAVSSQDYADTHTRLRFEDENDEDSYDALRRRERSHVIRTDYLEDYYSTTSYGDLIVQQRKSIVHWIIDESGVRQLNLETVFLSVSLLDRFLSKGYFKTRRKLQLLGIACLTLATRIEENQTVSCARRKTFQIGFDVYSRCEVVAMEWLVQKVLNFQCIVPTIHNFLWFYLKAAKADEEMEGRAKYLAVLSLMEPELLCYWPSTVAAGLVILSALASNHDSACQYIMETHIRTNNDDLPECIASLEWLVEYVN
ncbi:hypothetical protein MKW94_026801 [Papaver nudicaule]|uniref:Cyclin-like domain-containing protein n=1 Tax=Papaver nudicaule TaxID=74823 RepID=A0AA42AZ82_PAPNU|nr:hypothetical protein [Papaver nudicaule]